MDWNEIFQWSQKGFIVCCALTAQLTLSLAVGQQATHAKPAVNDSPLTAEQLAVYRSLLMSWFQGEKAAINLAVETDPIPAQDDSFDKQCLKGLSLETIAAGHVHRIRSEDAAQLSPFEIHLVDPEAQKKEVSENDPGKAIREGRQVDDAVRNAFAHGLMTLSEIQFDKSHTHALVSFSFVCGGLCGNGSTMLLEKRGDIWINKAQCGGWVS
jgi:hypothetical protein